MHLRHFAIEKLISQIEFFLKFLSNVELVDFLEDFTILDLYKENQPISSTPNKMLTLNFKSLKNFRIDQGKNFLKISPFLSNIKATLQAVHLCGDFDAETYKTVINGLPKLKTLIIASYVKSDKTAELDSLNLQLKPNHTVENLCLEITTNQRNNTKFPICFTKMTNVKVLFLYQNGFESLESNIDSMTKLHTVYLREDIDDNNTCMFKFKFFPNVKTLCLREYYSSKQFEMLLSSFPNIEKLIICTSPGDEVDDFFDLEIIPRGWKSLKHLEFDHVFHTTISSFIKLLRDFPKLKTVAISPEALLWNMGSLDSDREVLKNFTKNGLELFAVCSEDDQAKMTRTYFESPSLKTIVQEFTLSTGVKINI